MGTDEGSLADPRMDPVTFEQILVRASRHRSAGTTVGQEDARDSLLSSPQCDIASAERSTFTPDELTGRLGSRVLDQTVAVHEVVRAVIAPLNGLKLNPHRPEAMLLFNGPTGVGKTTMAEALADTVFGSIDQLIRIDCSELNGQASTTRLIGPPPGHVGYDDSSGWLTSRILEQPRSVVLFDEVEKASFEVWNLLLQIGDAGRLTDCKGRTADFSKSIVVLTSNIGATELTRSPLGFHNRNASPRVDQWNAEVERVLPPELLSRVDRVVTFEQLNVSSLVRIAQARLDDFVTRVVGQGWSLTVDSAVITGLVQRYSSTRLGARDVEHVLEQELLFGLAGLPRGAYRAESRPDRIEWVQVGNRD